MDRKDEHGPGAVVVSDAGIERLPVVSQDYLGSVLGVNSIDQLN